MSKTGVFTAPRAGKYSFSFHGNAAFDKQTPSIRSRFYMSLYLNGKAMNGGAFSDAMTSGEMQYKQISLQTSVDMKVGDKLWLQVNIRTKGASLWEDDDFITHYTGWLVEEDLSSVLKLA